VLSAVRILLTLALAIAACNSKKHVPKRADAETAARWHYLIRPSADLQQLEVRTCFAGRVPAALTAQKRISAQALLSARRVRGNEHSEIAHEPDQTDLSLASLEPDDWVVISLDLAAIVERASGGRAVRRLGRDLLISPDFWLWRPSGDLDDAQLTASFELPDGMSATVPWPRRVETGDFHIPSTSFRWGIYGAFGFFAPEVIEVAGSRLRVAILGDDWSVDRNHLREWLQSSARAVSLLYQGFPVEEAQILLIPVPGNEPAFGWTTQGGGPSVSLLTGTTSTPTSLNADWIAVHEMLHLGTPMIEDSANWLSEGLSTYYEPLLRARAGLIDATTAWETLHEGFARGARHGSGRTLRDECAEMDHTHQYWRVYWAGAAIAFIADVELRLRGSSLDEEMRRIRTCCASEPHIFTAGGLFTRYEPPAARTTPAPGGQSHRGLRTVAARYLDDTAFPDVEAAYLALGLEVDAAGKVTFADDARAAAIRKAMTGAPASAE